MQKAENSSKYGNANSTSKTDAGLSDFGAEIGSEILETLSDNAMDRIVQYISVLHYYAAQGKSPSGGSLTAGEKYNVYDVFAVQNYIWYVCNPNSRGIWYKIEHLGEAEIQKTKKAYLAIVMKANELFGSGVVTSFETDENRTTKPTKQAAENAPIILTDADTVSYTISSNTLANYQKIQYITLDGTTVQRFQAGDTVSSGTFSITNTGNGFDVAITGDPSETKYTVQFLTNNTITSTTGESDEDWAIYAQANSNTKQSFFTAYKAPKTANMFMSFIKSTDTAEKPIFPAFQFSQHKVDKASGYDGDSCTPVGDTKLNATFTLNYETDMGASGSVSSTADLYGHGASETILPWGKGDDGSLPSKTVKEEVVYDTYTEGEGDDATEIQYISGYIWTGNCTITIRESVAPEGHHNTNTTHSHTISYRATTSRNSPYEKFSEVKYDIQLDGKPTGLNTEAAIVATWTTPHSTGSEDTFVNEHWDGYLQIIKTIDSDDIFSKENGSGTEAGGVVPGKEYSSNSKWTIRLVDKNIYNVMSPEDAEKYLKFEGYEKSPYIRVVPDDIAKKQSNQNGWRDPIEEPEANPNDDLEVSEIP